MPVSNLLLRKSKTKRGAGLLKRDLDRGIIAGDRVLDPLLHIAP